MPCHPDRVRVTSPFEEHQEAAAVLETTLKKLFHADIRTLLNYLETEYVGPDVTQAMRRLREVVGYGG